MSFNQDIEVILLGYETYRFVDKKTGNNVELVGIYFVDREAENSEFATGYVPKKVNLSINVLPALKGLEFPYLANAKVEARLGKKGVVSKIVNFEPIEKIDIG